MANKQEGVTREGLLWNKSLLLSSPLRLSAYPLSHQSVRPLRHLSPAAFLRPVNRSHSSADRLMRLHKLRAPHTPDQRGRRRYTRGGGSRRRWVEGQRVDVCSERRVEGGGGRRNPQIRKGVKITDKIDHTQKKNSNTLVQQITAE